MRCDTHCPSGGGGLALAVVIALAAVIVVKVGQAVSHAFDTALRVLSVVLEVALITAGVAAVGAVVAVLAWCAVRLCRWQARRRPHTAIGRPVRVRGWVIRPRAALPSPEARLTGLEDIVPAAARASAPSYASASEQPEHLT